MTKEGMIRTLALFSAGAALVCAVPGAWADEKQMIEELREVRALVEQQAKQIDALTTQVSRLNHLIAEKVVAAPAPEATVAAKSADPFANAPKAEAAPEAPRHIVVKGETLTSIAKHYNVTLAELMKANTALNPAKLQIGQSVAIPNLKSPEQPAEKKETP